eukprot:10356277-Lingulodinium_polyedra.AAC.1
MFCLLHNKCCPVVSTTMHIAGSPCVDWSSQGLRKREDGPNMICTMAWVAQRYEAEDAIVFNENVRQFPPDVIMNVLTDKYIIQTT